MLEASVYKMLVNAKGVRDIAKNSLLIVLLIESLV
jgi:hypothetical protein